MLKINISDLTHNYKMVCNETMPLGAAYIKAYLARNLNDKVRCKLFRYPDTLIESIKKETPDVVMLSNYVWNEALGLFIVSLVKKINPRILTVMGGPNFSLDRAKQEEYMRKNFNLDFYITGEGEIPSLELIKLFLEDNQSIEQLKSRDLTSCVYIRCDNSFYQGKREPGLKNLDDIPSPWLLGYLDEFFDGKLAPLIESTRGCPFSCSYCVQGAESYSKIRQFPLERTKSEIAYIAERIRDKSPSVGFLCVADPNFGMYKNDVEVSRVIREARKKYGWPTFVDATTGKNNSNHILQTAANLKDMLVMYNSVQSMNPVVLRNINRKNINFETMRDIQKRSEEMGIKTLTETILSLPGETFESHKDGLFQLIRLGIKQFTNYQCMVLKGSHMETKGLREKFKIDTRYRILPRSFGIYDGNKVLDIEEIVSSTSTLSFSDYLNARKLHLILIIYYNGLYFEPLMELIKIYGADICCWLEELFKNIDEANRSIVALFDDFMKETKNELFDSHAQCVEFYAKEKNFQRLLRGEIGGNLIMKYSLIATFHIWGDIVKYGFGIAKKLIASTHLDAEADNFLDDLENFLRCRLAKGEFSTEILSNDEAELRFNIKAWIDDKYNGPLDKYRFKIPATVRFYLPEEKHRILKNALSVYSEDIIGKAKLVTRIQYADRLKECQVLSHHK